MDDGTSYSSVLEQFEKMHHLADIPQIISMHRANLAQPPDPESDRSQTLADLGITLHARFILDGLLPDLEEAIMLLREALTLRPAPHTHRLPSLTSLAAALSTRFQQTGRLPDLTDPIALLREALLLMPRAHPERPTILSDLARVLHDRSKWGAARWNDQDTTEAITLYREALTLQLELHADSRRLLSSLAEALHSQYLQASAQGEPPSLPHLPILDEAIQLYHDAFSENLPSASRSASLNRLALALQTHFTATHRLESLDRAIKLHRQSLADLPDHNLEKPSLLANLVRALHTRYEQTMQREDLQEAISLHHATLLLPATRRRSHSYAFNVLEPVLRTRFTKARQVPVLTDGELPDYSVLTSAASFLRNRTSDSEPTPQTDYLAKLDEVVESCRNDITSQVGDRAILLERLAVALRTRFEKQGDRNVDTDMISEAISLLEEVLQLRPEPHPERASSLQNLARTHYANYMADYHVVGMYFILDTAISLFRDALALHTPSHSDRSSIVDDLGAALHTRFVHGGKLLDLDEAVMLHREALSLRPTHHPDRPSSLSNLAVALQTRSEQARQIPDLKEAITLHEEVLSVRPERDPLRSETFHKLGLAYHSLFLLGRLSSDLEQSIEFYRTALALQPNTHPGRPSSLSDLAVALHSRYKRTHVLADLNDAVALHREAFTLLPENHYDYLEFSKNLADALLLRSEETGRLRDLEEVIELCRELLHSFFGPRSRDDPGRCPLLEFLGRALISRFLRADLAGNHKEDVTEAMDSYEAIVYCYPAPLSQRFPAARMWARLSDAMDDGHGLALQQYRVTIELLPLLAGVGVDVEARQRALIFDTDGLAREAAACAIRQQKYHEAVELLEAGRAVFWALALQLRTPLDDLDAADPALAQKYRDLSRSLERGALRDVSGTVSDGDEGVASREKDSVRYRQLETDWLEIIEEIRGVEGFHDFLQPKIFSTLSAAAANGTVVILNASSFRAECDALVVVNSQVLHIPLKDLRYRTLEALVRNTRVATNGSLPSVRQSRAAMPALSGAKDADAVLQKVLSILWKSVVEPIFQILQLKKSETPPRLWWMATGPFASLPIHAAGNYGDPSGEAVCVSDYVVSSYIPTFNALLTPPPPSTETFKALAVIQPVTPGQAPLVSTEEELRKIENHIVDECLIKYGGSGKRTVVQDVLDDLVSASIVHFACHGVQDTTNPLNSSLLLEDRLKISRLMELDMPNASLVFLSACQTAAGDGQLPDEAMHLAATLLFTGFRGAVATMWSIHDEDGPRVADSFYQSLMKTGNTPTSPPDFTSAAHALHVAIKAIRNEGCSFIRWVPFIHLGL